MVNSVQLSSDVYLVCLCHALSTEREEVMGLLLGEVGENRVVQIYSAYVMRRSDRRPDRVEISPEQLSAAAIEAERLEVELKRPVRVIGWYHSHPHITVWPSHVDVRTQANYQQMEPNFVGLIFSCFNETEKGCGLQVICFQSVDTGEGCLEHVQLLLSVTPTVGARLGAMATHALTGLPSILLEEEQGAYALTKQSSLDLLTCVHNSGVYMQLLSRMLQVMVTPLLHFLEEQITQNKKLCQQLQQEKEQLSHSLETLQTSQDS